MINFVFETQDEKITVQTTVDSEHLEDVVAAFENFLYAAGFNFAGTRLDFVPDEMYENGWIQPRENEVI